MKPSESTKTNQTYVSSIQSDQRLVLCHRFCCFPEHKEKLKHVFPQSHRKLRSCVIPAVIHIKLQDSIGAEMAAARGAAGSLASASACRFSQLTCAEARGHTFKLTAVSLLLIL